MRIILLLLLTLPITGCGERDAPVANAPQTMTGSTPELNEPQFIFIAPHGFEWNDKHGIWHNPTTRTSVTLAHAPGISFQTVVDDFEADRMLAAKTELTFKEVRPVGGRATLLVLGNRLAAPYPQEFVTVAFGTSTGCAQLTAIYPKEANESMKKQIQKSLLNAKYEEPN